MRVRRAMASSSRPAARWYLRHRGDRRGRYLARRGDRRQADGPDAPGWMDGRSHEDCHRWVSQCLFIPLFPCETGGAGDGLSTGHHVHPGDRAGNIPPGGGLEGRAEVSGRIVVAYFAETDRSPSAPGQGSMEITVINPPKYGRPWAQAETDESGATRFVVDHLFHRVCGAPAVLRFRARITERIPSRLAASLAGATARWKRLHAGQPNKTPETQDSRAGLGARWAPILRAKRN